MRPCWEVTLPVVSPVVPEGTAAASRTTASSPARCSSTAVVRPVSPAPAMTTSAVAPPASAGNSGTPTAADQTDPSSATPVPTRRQASATAPATDHCRNGHPVFGLLSDGPGMLRAEAKRKALDDVPQAPDLPALRTGPSPQPPPDDGGGTRSRRGQSRGHREIGRAS